MNRRVWRVIQVLEEAIHADSEQEAVQIFLDQKDLIPPSQSISVEEVTTHGTQRTPENGTTVS